MFNDRLREARNAKNLTQGQLAKKIGTGKSTVTGYELGNSEPPMATLLLIMKELEVDANYLWQDELKAIGLAKEIGVSPAALSVARAYDQLSDYGKAVIATVIEQEKKNKPIKRIPIIGTAWNDGRVETKLAARQEAKELAEEAALTEIIEQQLQ